MPEPVEKQATPETENSTEESVRWIRDRVDQLKKDKAFSQQTRTIENTLQILDEKLEINPDRTKTIVEKSLNDFFEINHVPSRIRKFVLINLTKLMVLKYGESDPGGDWWDSFLRQSKEVQENLLSTLISCAGCWQTGFEIKDKTESGGAKELQVSLAQVLTDLSHVLYNTASTEIKNTQLPYDDITKEKLKSLSADFIQKNVNSEIPWSANPDLFGTKNKKGGDTQKYNPFIFALQGELKQREIDSFEELPIRLFREVNGITQYCDMPASAVLSIEKNNLKNILTTLDSYDHKWQEITDFPDLGEPGPCISLSISGKPNPDSLLYLHARSGKSMIHLNFNTQTEEIEAYFNHLNFDGNQGIDLALGMAEAVGTPEAAKPKGLWIDWQPPTQITEELAEDELDDVIDIIDHDASGKNFQDEEEVQNFVYSLNVSDITISNDLDTQNYKTISELVNKINETWFVDMKDKLEEIIEADVAAGKRPPSDKAKSEILNRLLGTKMTVTKFMDIIGRDFYGPTAVCTVPREPSDPEVRLMVLNPPVLEDGQSADLDDLRRAYTDMICEYARTHLQNFSPLIALQNEMDEYRRTGEIASYLLTQEAFESAMLKAMFSHIKSISKNKGQVKLSKFTSALTTSNESSFALAVGDIPIDIDGEDTIRYSHRQRATPSSIESLDFFSTNIDAEIDAVSMQIGKNSLESSEITIKAKQVLSGLKELIPRHYNDSKNANPSNLVLFADFLKTSKNRAEDYQIVRHLVIAGMFKRQNDFYNTVAGRAKAYLGKF